MNRFIRTVDLINQTVMPKYTTNWEVLPIYKVFESKSIKLICLDTKSLEYFDPILF